MKPPSCVSRALVALLVALAALAGCKGLPHPKGVPRKYSAPEVPQAILDADADLRAGRNDAAFARSRIARKVRGLPAEQRSELESLLQRSAERYIAELSAPGSSPKPLKAIFDLDLPMPQAVAAGEGAARLYYARGKRFKTFRFIKRIDKKHPHHYSKVGIGSLLAAVGFDLASDPRRYGLFFKYRNSAPQVLEYLVINYPNHPRCAEAYDALAQIYEEQGLWEDAIARREDLLLWHSGSPYVALSKARIPHLRLRSLASPEYDHTALERALAELDAWLARYPRHELRETVEVDRLDCLRRLTDAHMIVARFYKRVRNPAGAEYHARRAVDFARIAQYPDQLEEARDLLEGVVAAKQEQSS